MKRLQAIAAGSFARRRGRRRRAAAGRCDHDLHRHRDALCVLLDGRRRGRALRLCARHRQRLGLLRGAAQPLAHPHRHRLCARAAAASGPRSTSSAWLLRVLLRARHLARLGRAAAVLRVRLALAVRARDAARHAAGAVVRGPGVLRRGRAAAAGARALACVSGDLPGCSRRSARNRPWRRPRRKSSRSSGPSSRRAQR